MCLSARHLWWPKRVQFFLESNRCLKFGFISSLETFGKGRVCLWWQRFVNASGWHFGGILCLSCEVFNYSSAAAWKASHPVICRWWPRLSNLTNGCPPSPFTIRLRSGGKKSSAALNLDSNCYLLLSQAILDVVVNLQFSLIEKLWQTFWRYSPPDSVEGATVTENRWIQVDNSF